MKKQGYLVRFKFLIGGCDVAGILQYVIYNFDHKCDKHHDDNISRYRWGNRTYRY